jgi:hypothetical protein
MMLLTRLTNLEIISGIIHMAKFDAIQKRKNKKIIKTLMIFANDAWNCTL